MKKTLALFTACIALTLAACGGDDEEDEPAGGGTGAPAEQADTGAAPSGPVTVDMKNNEYVPSEITVKAGAKVTWTNSDGVPHTVTKTDGPGPDFDSGNIEGGAEYERTFKAKGEIDYVCTIHPGQEGSITVQ